MPEDFQRRLPSRECSVSEIQPEDIRIKVTGTIIDINKEGTRLVVDDGTGKIAITSESKCNAEMNQLVRVFGRVIPLEQGSELQGDVVQDMKKLDLELLKKVKGLKI